MTFREKVQRKLCWLWWRFNRERAHGPFRISATGVQPKHLMLVLPPEFHDFDIARLLIDPILDRTQPRAATIVLRENFRTWLSPDLRAKVVTFDIAKQNWLGLPTNGICEKAQDVGADVVIDLTPTFTPYTAAISSASRAPLRITVDNQFESGFYNFFIRGETERPLAERYDMLLKYV